MAGEVEGKLCKPCPADSYCPTDRGKIPCSYLLKGSGSPAGSYNLSQCVCRRLYEAVRGECVPACVAEPGESYCAEGLHLTTPCEAGWACEGGRGVDRVPCAAVPGSYCPGEGVLGYLIKYPQRRRKRRRRSWSWRRERGGGGQSFICRG